MKIALWVGAMACFQLSFSQHIQKMEHCGCVDEVQTIAPVLEGNYSRHCNGKLIESGAFTEGVKTGEWSTRSAKGQLIRRFHYVKGKLHGNVSVFYPDGTIKLQAAFSQGLPDSSWTYYTPKGKPWVTGKYTDGEPVGLWTIADKKGNSPVVEYDFTKNQAGKNGDPAFLRNRAIVKNDNTHQYFILYYPDRIGAKEPSPLGGYHFASDLFVQLMEVPLDYWDTYVSYKYKWKVSLTTSHVATHSVSVIDDHLNDEVPVLPFIINTNRDGKLKRVEHSELSRKLLDYKIREALSLLPPWINQGEASAEVYVPYVINQIIRQ